MYYYQKENEEIVKYHIILDEDNLKKLRSEIIEKCSLITHKNYKTTNTPNEYDYEHIRNYKENKVGVIEYNDFYCTKEDEYLVDYDYYEHPKLVSLIEELLSGNTKIINELKNPNIECINEEEILLKEQQKIIKKLNNCNDISKQIELLTKNQQKLLEYKKQKELNKNQIPVEPYYKKVLDCITMKKVNSISMDLVNEYTNFFMSVSTNNIDEKVNKVLEKKKN
jgi:hypothetical protein